MDLNKYLNKPSQNNSPNLLTTFMNENKDRFEQDRLKELERQREFELRQAENQKNNKILQEKQALSKPVSSKMTILQKTQLRNEAERKATDDFIAKNGAVPKGIFNKEVKAYSDKIHSDKGAFGKTIDYIADAPYRIPFLNKTLNAVSDAIAPGANDGLNAPAIYSRNNSENKVSDVAANLIGGTIGLGMNPGGVLSPGTSLLNIGDDIALQGANKIAPKLGNGLIGKIGTGATRGVIDGGLGGSLDTLNQGQGLKELPGNVVSGAVGGGLLMGGSTGLKTVKEGIGNSLTKGVNNLFDEIGNPIKTVETPSLSSNPFKNPVNDGLNLPKKSIETPVIDKKPSLNIKNPSGKNFYQTLPGKTETTIHRQPKVTIKKEKVNIDGNIGSIKIADRNNVIEKLDKKTGKVKEVDILSDTKVNALQYDFPELKPHIQEQAKLTLGELENGQKGETIHTNNKVTGEHFKDIRPKNMSETIHQIQGELPNTTYAKIKKGLNDLIEDDGKENNVTAKKIERVLDRNLSEGYTYEIGGQTIDMPPNKDFIENKNMLIEMEKGTKVNVNDTVFKGNVETPITKTLPGERVPIKQSTKIEPLPPVNKKTMAAFKDSPKYAKMEIGEDEIADILGQGSMPKSSKIAPVDENFNPSDKPYNNIVSSKKEKVSFKQKLKNVYTRIVDNKNPIKSASNEAYMLATNSKNVGGTVDHILTKELVDMNSNKIDGSFKEIVNSIPKDKEEVFKELLYQNHNIARAEEGKPIFFKDEKTPFTSLESKARYDLLAKENPELVEVSNKFTKWIDTFMNEWGVKSGLTKEDIYKELRDIYPNYVPTQREFSQLEKGITAGPGKGFLNTDNPVKKAKGSNRDVLDPVENVMNLVNRTVRSARYNEVGQALLSSIKNNPTKLSQFAEIIPPKEGIFANTKNILSVLEDGKQVYIKVNDLELLKSLESVNSTQSNAFLDGVNKYVSNPFKQLITQKNPLFAATNIARDLPTAYINGSEINPLKFAKNLGGAIKDIATDSKNYNRYKASGGGGSNFFKGTDIGKTVKELQGKNSIPKKFMNVIETFNNMTETAPRLAEFNKIYKETGDIQKALYASNDVTTNFSRGGDITKSVDKITPYLNAGVQGLDKLARQLNPKNPKQAIETLIKGGIAITTPSIFLHYLNADNEDYQALDNRTKDNNFLIPTNNGKFIKIPKSRELGVMFGSLFERLARATNGSDDAFKGFGNTVATNISVANPIEENIFRPFIDLKSNKDFANRTIVNQSMQNLSKENQYDEKTTELSKFIGKKFKISPKQMDFLIKSYTGVIGTFAIPGMTKSSYEGGIGKALTKPITTKFVADPIYSNQVTNDFYENIDKITKKAADKNLNDNIPSKTVTEEEKMKSVFTKSSKKITEINKAIRNTKEEEKIRKLKKLAQEEMERTNKLFNKSKFK